MLRGDIIVEYRGRHEHFMYLVSILAVVKQTEEMLGSWCIYRKTKQMWHFVNHIYIGANVIFPSWSLY